MGLLPGRDISFLTGKYLIEVETLGFGHLHIPAIVQVEAEFGFDLLYGLWVFMNWLP